MGMTNAEVLSELLKEDIEQSACAIRRMCKEFSEIEDLIDWLESEAEFYEGKV